MKEIKTKYGITSRTLYCPELRKWAGSVNGTILLTYLIARSNEEGKVSITDEDLAGKLGFSTKELRTAKSRVVQPISSKSRPMQNMLVWSHKAFKGSQTFELNKQLFGIQPTEHDTVADEIEAIAKAKKSQDPNASDIYTKGSEQRHHLVQHMIDNNQDRLLLLVVGLKDKAPYAVAPSNDEWDALILHAGWAIIEFENKDLEKRKDYAGLRIKYGVKLLHYIFSQMEDHENTTVRGKGKPNVLMRIRTWVRNHTQRGYGKGVQIIDDLPNRKPGSSQPKVFDGFQYK